MEIPYDILIFDLEHSCTSFWCGLLDIEILEQRQLIVRYNSSLSFYIFEEDNAQHHRLHFHALINSKKVASVFLDTLEVDFKSSKIKQKDIESIKNWVKTNKSPLKKICKNKGGGFDIPFNELKT